MDTQKQREWKHRTIHCAQHPLFAADVCPYCPKGSRAQRLASTARAIEPSRQSRLDDSVLRIAATDPPETFSALAHLASERLGFHVVPSEAAASLRRLYKAGKTTLQLQRQDGRVRHVG